MNLEYQIIYVLSAIAAATTFARVTTQSKTGLLDWVAMGSVALLAAQVISLLGRPTF